MRQAVVIGYKKVVIRDVPVPKINIDEVLIKIKRIGICGSDIHVYNGVHLYNEYPIVQGHEVAGDIVKTGKNVKEYSVGDKVTIQPQVVCNKCYQCRHGNYHVCDALNVLGFQAEGAACEYFGIDAKKVLKLPDSFSYDKGAMVEPVAVAVHAVNKLKDISGKDILVLGAGPIGNLVSQVCKAGNAKAVMITDLNDFRLDVSKECGIDYCINAKTENLEAELAEKFGEKKADAILECVGSNATINQAIDVARKSTDIVIVGVLGTDTNINMGIVQDHELKIIGTLMYQRKDFESAIDLIEKGKVKVEKLITNHFDLTDFNKAYEQSEKEKAIKIMITV